MSRPGHVRATVPADTERLNGLFDRVFGVTRDESVWRWKYFDNPFGTHSWVYESTDGRLVFHCGGVEVPFVLRGRRTFAVQLTDFMSDPAFPGGVGPGSPFGRTVAAFFEDLVEEGRVEVLYGFPGERHRLVGEKILGYQTVVRVQQFTIEASGQNERALATDQVDPERWQRSRLDYTGVDRTSQWVDWRFLQRPDRSYGMIAEGESRIIVHKSPTTNHLMELSISTSSELGRMIDVLRETGRQIVGWFPSNGDVAQALISNGFEMSARDHYLTAAIFSDTPDLRGRSYFRPPGSFDSSFFYTLGDYDVE